MNLYNDGTERNTLIMHAGGYKMPHSEQTSKLVDIGDGTMKSYEELWMDGSKVFNFVQKEVPPLIEEILDYSIRAKQEPELQQIIDKHQTFINKYKPY